MFRTSRFGAAAAASAAALSTASASASAAPVPAHHFVDINAPRATVWRIFTHVNAWTTWQPHITAARLNPPQFRPGSSFTWTSEGFTVTSHIRAVRRGSRVVWAGIAQGITGTHEWLLRDTPHGTRVITTESFSGAPVEANVSMMQSILDTSLAYWLAQLKARAERGA